MDATRDRIRELRRKNTEGHWFIPEGSLGCGLSHEIVQTLLRNHCNVRPFEVQQLTDIVESGAKKVFAILILIRLETNITKFVEYYRQSEKLDSQLPFSKSRLEDILPPARAQEFDEQQWEFIAPVFRHETLIREFHTDIRLPFIESRKLGQGAFGNVFEVVIPAAHHNFKKIDEISLPFVDVDSQLECKLTPEQDARIVRKELRDDGELTKLVMSNEHEIMSYLHGSGHPNILPLFAVYRYHGVLNFLLPLAEGGDLEHFLSAERSPKGFAEETSFYAALSGLSSALETLHSLKPGCLDTEMIGYHHDLKPRNVLVAGSRFVLSDFGLSKLKTGEDSQTPFKKGQGYYLAPECEDLEHDFSKGVISRASDVWSLGCIVLEVIVFMVGGNKALSEFREHRTIKNGFLTTKTFFRGESINPEVERKMCELADCENAGVRKAVALIRQILVVDFKKRLKANGITVRLRLISFETFYLRLRDAFQSIKWRIDSTDVIAEWNKFRHITHNLTLRDDTMAFHSLDAKDLEPFTNQTHVERLLGSMERLLNYIVSSDLSSDPAQGILLNLRKVNGLLSLRLSDTQGNRDLDNEATQLETDSLHSTSRPTDSEHLRNLGWNDCAFTVATTAVRNATISKNEKLLAVECDWQITIYALPSGEKVQEIKMPDELQPFRRAWDGGHPAFGFSPDEKNLIVCWIRHVCSYRVGRDENGSSMVFTLLTERWFANRRERHESVMMPEPINLAAVSPDSTKVVFEVHRRMNPYSDSFDHLIYIVPLTKEKAADAVDADPIQATVGAYDFVFGFSPDGRQLAVSSQKTVQHDKRDAIRIRVLDIIHTGFNQLPMKWVTLYCDQKFNKGPSRQYLPVLQDLFSAATYPRLMFGVWEGRWVAALWRKSERTLVLHDLHSENHLASFDLSCLDAFDSGMKNAIFSDNLRLAASRKSPSSDILRKFKRGKENVSDNLIAFANVTTNQVVCILEGPFFDHYWLSNAGQYAVVQKKKELRVFRLLEG